MTQFLDASALVKMYLVEEHSAWVKRLVAAGTPAVSRLTYVEVTSALCRRARQRLISTTERDDLLELVEEHFRRLHVVEVTARITTLSTRVLRRRALRAGDAIQLATCIAVQQAAGNPIPFLAFDERLNEAARDEGLELATLG